MWACNIGPKCPRNSYASFIERQRQIRGVSLYKGKILQHHQAGQLCMRVAFKCMLALRRGEAYPGIAARRHPEESASHRHHT